MSKRTRMRARVFPVHLRESAAVAERAELRESVFGAIGAQPAVAAGGGLLVDVQIIEAGWNRSGSKYYPADVLVRDAPIAFPVGTHAHLDHPTLSDEVERPERSLQTLAAVVAETPYSPDGGKTMRAKFRIFSPYATFIREAWENIGVSINADGSGRYGETEGRQGLLVEAITVGKSIDFVTKPGAGGRIISLLESAREDAQTFALREARNVGAWLESRLHLSLTELADNMYGDGRLTRDERIALSSALSKGLQAYTAEVESLAPQLFQRDLWANPDEMPIAESARLRETTADQIRTALDAAVRALYGDGTDAWCWIRDYDPDKGLVWFEAGDKAETGTWQQSFTTSGNDAAVTAALTGDRVEVVAQTVYVLDKAADATGVVEADRPAPVEAPTTDVTDGTPPTGSPNPTESEESAMAETQTGVMPGQAGTASVADTAAVEVQAREAEAARVKAVEERDTALREAENSKQELARFRAVEAARPIASAKLAESGLPAAARARVLAAIEQRVPLTEALALDEAKLTALIDAEATAEKTYLASLAEADGAGRVRGFGGVAQSTEPAQPVSFRPAPPPANTALVEAFRARGMSEQAATLAAGGRAI